MKTQAESTMDRLYRHALKIMELVRRSGSNMAFNVKWFGDEMRKEKQALDDGGVSIPDFILQVFNQADACVQAYCDGKPCPLVVNW